ARKRMSHKLTLSRRRSGLLGDTRSFYLTGDTARKRICDGFLKWVALQGLSARLSGFSKTGSSTLAWASHKLTRLSFSNVRISRHIGGGSTFAPTSAPRVAPPSAFRDRTRSDADCPLPVLVFEPGIYRAQESPLL